MMSLDALVAYKVMGWQFSRWDSDGHSCVHCGRHTDDCPDMGCYFSTEPEAAQKVLMKLHDWARAKVPYNYPDREEWMMASIEMGDTPSGQWWVNLIWPEIHHEHKIHTFYGDTWMEAVCIAALRMIGGVEWQKK